MTITFKIDTGNAAFGADEADKRDEIERIIIAWIGSGGLASYRSVSHRLRDINGNTVGTVTVRGK